MSQKKKPSHPSPFVRHIEDLYEAEASEAMRDSLIKPVTLNFPVADACMLAAIAKRFGQSTASFGGELFAEHVRELFLALTPADRRELAVEADTEQQRFIESKGNRRGDLVFDANSQVVLPNAWQRYADLCDKHEGGAE